MCWYCYWGVSEPVAEIYQEAVRRLDGNDTPLLYGPSHIVWEDYNLHAAKHCLEHFEEFAHYSDYTPEELAVVRWSLEELAKLPPEVADIMPDDCDPLHPELFPPTVKTVKI